MGDDRKQKREKWKFLLKRFKLETKKEVETANACHISDNSMDEWLKSEVNSILRRAVQYI